MKLIPVKVKRCFDCPYHSKINARLHKNYDLTTLPWAKCNKFNFEFYRDDIYKLIKSQGFPEICEFEDTFNTSIKDVNSIREEEAESWREEIRNLNFKRGEATLWECIQN